MSFFGILNRWLRNALLAALSGYRWFLAPWLGGACRFYPSCSRYAEEAVALQPLGRALGLIGKRLLSCHPYHPGGFDPVPPAGGVSHVA